METVCEAGLVARLQAGDQDAFEELVRTYGGRLEVLDAAADAVAAGGERP